MILSYISIVTSEYLLIRNSSEPGPFIMYCIQYYFTYRSFPKVTQMSRNDGKSHMESKWLKHAFLPFQGFIFILKSTGKRVDKTLLYTEQTKRIKRHQEGNGDIQTYIQ